MTIRHPHAGEPHLLHSMTEWRALLEMASLPFMLPALMAAPQGDGHPVLLLPGFMADEGTLIALKTFLRNRGYAVESWGFGRNVGFQNKHAQALEQKIRYMHHKSGRKVSLVGWSLGGVFALYGAHQASECVRTRDHARQPGQRRPRGQPLTGVREGALPDDRASDGPGGARDAAARQEAARDEAACRCR